MHMLCALYCRRANMDAKDRTFLNEVSLDKCVFCQVVVGSGVTGAGKVLPCMHLACKLCIQESVTLRNKATCARCQTEIPDPGHGETVVDSLSDWPGWNATSRGVQSESGQFGGDLPSDDVLAGEPKAKRSLTEARLVCEAADCCDADADACTKCKECDMLLCDGHTIVHRRSKKSCQHTLLQLDSERRDHALHSQKCRLHITSDLVKFCMTCNTLLCDVCLTKSPLHSSHDVVDIATAAEVCKEAFSKQLARFADDEIDEGLALKQVWLEEQKTKIENEAEAVSTAITADFEKMHRQLRDREEKLVADLNTLCWSRLKTLEKRDQELVEMRGKIKISRHLVERLESVYLVRSAESVVTVLEKDVASACEDEEDYTLRASYETFSEYFGEEVQEIGAIAVREESAA